MTPEEYEITQSVDKAVDKLNELAYHTLSTYHYIGKLVSELDSSYGDKVVERFSNELAARVGNPDRLSPSTLYRCRKFYEKYESTLDTFIEAGVSWNQVVQSLGAPSDEVENTLEKIIEGEIKPTELSKYANDEPLIEDEDTDEDIGATAVPELDPDIGEPVEPSESTSKSSKAPREVGGGTTEDASAETPDGSVASVNKECSRSINYIEHLIDRFGNVIIALDHYENFNESFQSECEEDLTKLHAAMKKLNESGSVVWKKLNSYGL